MSGEREGEIENVAPETTANLTGPNALEKSPTKVEQEQEAQLRAKYPGMKGPATSVFLQKRLSQKTKFFDSGDYAMAKAKGGSAMTKQPLPAGVTGAPAPELPTGEAIPTPENVHHRKQANRLSKLVSMS